MCWKSGMRRSVSVFPSISWASAAPAPSSIETQMAVTLSLPPRSRAESTRRSGEAFAVLAEDLRDLLVRQVPVQAVGAEDEQVAGEDVGHQRVHRHLRLDSDRAGDHVPVLAGARLLAGDQAALDLFLHEGVVLGELVGAAVAVQVDAAVADVPDHRLFSR